MIRQATYISIFFSLEIVEEIWEALQAILEQSNVNKRILEQEIPMEPTKEENIASLPQSELSEAHKRGHYYIATAQEKKKAIELVELDQCDI